MARLRSFWNWLSPPGRVLFAGALFVGVVLISISWAQGDREGGAPGVMLTLLLLGVVALDAIGRGIFATIRRR